MRYYKDSMTKLSALADTLQRLESRHAETDEEAVHRDLIELLQHESEAKKTFDHLLDAVRADMEIEAYSVKVAESMAKLREIRDELELLYISKTVN